jgi:muconolactone D-isomerase
MMEFLVNIKLKWADNMDPVYRDKIIHDEHARAADLAKKGHLVRMWRVPCRFENWGLWRAKNATELHEIITSLPAFPYMYDIDVRPLAKHAVDPTPFEK